MSTNKALEAKLKAARKLVNIHKFGTPAWEDAMVTVRALCEQIEALEPPCVYNSREGDVFSV